MSVYDRTQPSGFEGVGDSGFRVRRVDPLPG
jgi:hypothetical protein